MSDFLTRLVERTTETKTAVNPLVAPLFAPGPPLKDQFRSQITSGLNAAPIESANPAQQGNPPSPLTSRLCQPVRGPVGAGAEEIRLPGVTHTAKGPFVEQGTQDALNPENPARVVPAGRTTNAVGMQQAPDGKGELFAMASRIIQRRGGEGDHTLLGGHPISDAVPAGNNRSENWTETGAREMATVSKTPGTPPLSAKPGNFPRTPDRSAETPTIKVSIGRIEVRAVTEQPPTPRPAPPASPKVSLDQYLEKQSRGKP